MNPKDALRAYLKVEQIKPADFARRLEYDRGNFHRLINKPDARPSLDLALRIERETAGAVPVSAWAIAA